jgi:oligopeptide transport system substrate-binding protein
MRSLIFSLILFTQTALADAGVFRFHLFSEPQTLDPQTTASSGGNYLFQNIYRGLFVYADGKLKPEGAETCRHSKLKVRCTLRPMKWSDGKPVTARQYVNAFRRLIDPDKRSPKADILFTLKNARAIWKGEKKPDQLGVAAEDEKTLVFHFEEEDPEFEYRLIEPSLTPLPDGGYLNREEGSKLPVNGPYKIAGWKKGAWLKLEPNPEYALGRKDRPPAEALFVDSDATALRLYEAGTLTFLRRLTAADIPRFKDSPEFIQIPMARFDYVGFGPALRDRPKLREALVKSVEFKDFLRLFNTISPPGCPSLPASYMDQVTCMKFDSSRAKSLMKSLKDVPPLEMQFSQMGGDDIARAAEWFQGQWKKNAGLKVELHSQEQSVYMRTLRVNTPAVFRKGVNLDRPTCAAGLEIFVKDNPENFIRLDDPEFEKRLKRVSQASSPTSRKRACREAVNYLMSLNRLIPLGEMYFTLLAKKSYAGWTLNELNQLDLSQLHKIEQP